MRRGTLAATAALLAGLAGTVRTAHAGHGAVFVPPLEVELGHAVIGAPQGGTMEATQLMIGVSWASLFPRDTPVDFSVGVICNIFPEPDAAGALARGAAPAAERRVDSGGFIDVAVRTARGRHWRMWAGGRGELIDLGEASMLGAAARASMELWLPAVGGDSSGGGFAAVLGTVALSAWAEAGVREQLRGGAASFVASGLGMRIPLMVAGG